MDTPIEDDQIQVHSRSTADEFCAQSVHYLYRRPDIGNYKLDNLNRNRPSGAVGRRRQLQLQEVPLAVAQDGDELVGISAAHGHNFRLRASHIELIPPWIRRY